uniref:Uncharacterized protein n=1 Tax=Candidatus Kentrum sp. LPFa TaxID=2126335 RepID=A0A450VYW1_9GAMM|nr:MAG: hypothetical protein BECKLPF1236A_GA0070988_1002920 [Candidatus Kentron sp. LPFa]VFK26185.1 MAG: hypothetical protein BECKLPF1236C_GA0070990_1003120 [Candidatus Kentron sp. LPFa]
MKKPGIFLESFAQAILGSAKQWIEKNVIFSILQNQIRIAFDFGGASLCHEILHFVQKSLPVFHATIEGRDLLDGRIETGWPFASRLKGEDSGIHAGSLRFSDTQYDTQYHALSSEDHSSSLIIHPPLIAH